MEKHKFMIYLKQGTKMEKYKFMIYSKKKIFIELLYDFIQNVFANKNISMECDSIIKIEIICSLDNIVLGLYDEKNIILLDFCQKEEWNSIEQIICKSFDYNKTVKAHVVLLDDLYCKDIGCNFFRCFEHLYTSLDTEDLKKIIEQIVYLEKKEEQKEKDSNSLTKREKEILILITNGMLNKEIANELNITERTVKNHISNLFKKIDVYDRTQAAVYAIKNRIYNMDIEEKWK